MTGFVYAITDEHDRVKLGWSANPSSRFVKIQADNGANCRLVGFVPATREQEAELHEVLAPWRVTGEWFRASAKPVAHFMSCVRLPEKKKRKVKGKGRLADFFASSGMTQADFAADIGCCRPTVSRLVSGKQRPGFELMREIVRATNGAVTPNDFLDEPSNTEAAE